MANSILAAKQQVLADPLDARFYSNLGIALGEAYSYGPSLKAYGKALSLAPDNPVIRLNLGVQYRRTGLVDEAVAILLHVVEDAPQLAEARFSLAVALLTLGRFTDAWPLYEARFQLRTPAELLIAPRSPAWTVGQVVDSLWLVAEQGMGDVLHFIRWVPLMRQWASSLVLVVHPALVPLLAGLGVADQVIEPSSSQMLTGSAWLPLLSIPAALRLMGLNVMTTEWIPNLKVSQRSRAEWCERLSPSPACLVGLFWQGNPRAEVGDLAGRSIPLECLAPLAGFPGVGFVALQKDEGLMQLEHCSFRHRFIAAQNQVSASRSFVDTGAVAMTCDLVITTDSAVAHLCGSLGVPTWLLLQAVPDWRWGLEGEASALYPGLRLFRQQKLGDWSDVIANVVSAFRVFRAAPSS